MVVVTIDCDGDGGNKVLVVGGRSLHQPLGTVLNDWKQEEEQHGLVPVAQRCETL